jgi:hypothetical protein
MIPVYLPCKAHEKTFIGLQDGEQVLTTIWPVAKYLQVWAKGEESSFSHTFNHQSLSLGGLH